MEDVGAGFDDVDSVAGFLRSGLTVAVKRVTLGPLFGELWHTRDLFISISNHLDGAPALQSVIY
jgi:hypothetical protein